MYIQLKFNVGFGGFEKAIAIAESPRAREPASRLIHSEVAESNFNWWVRVTTVTCFSLSPLATLETQAVTLRKTLSGRETS